MPHRPAPAHSVFVLGRFVLTGDEGLRGESAARLHGWQCPCRANTHSKCLDSERVCQSSLGRVAECMEALVNPGEQIGVGRSRS